MGHDFYSLFSAYWWLIFPLFWMCAALAKLWLRHARANRTLDILKSYAEQGKEPSPELLAALQVRPDEQRRQAHSEYLWIPVCLFAALAVAFASLAIFPNDLADGHKPAFAFVTIVMIGLALGNLAPILIHRRRPPDEMT